MKLNRLAGRGVAGIAALGLVAASFVAMTGSAQAAPGDASISATPNSSLNTTQVISVSGNAGPLSTDNNGAAPGGVPDTSYPTLHISMCRPPLTSTSCDTSLTNFGQPVTADPSTSPHVVDVTPDSAGNWGPINFLVRKTIVNGDGTFQCGTGANQCVIGSANSPRPADHSYDATQNLTFAAATLTYAAVNADLATTNITGTNLQMQVDGSGNPTSQNIYTFQCALPLGPSSCDSNPANYGTATVDKFGSFTDNGFVVHRTFTDSGSVTHDCRYSSCVIGTIKNPPGAPDGFSAYGTTDVMTVVPAPAASISSITGQTVLTAARAGNTINLTGSGWAPSGAVTVELCTTALASCSASQFTSSTVAADGSGNLSGGAVVDTSATTGARALKISQTTGEAASITITILGTPTLAGSPTAGGTGTVVAVTGSNWNPGSTVSIVSQDVSNAPTGGPVSVTASATGSISGNYTVNAPTTDKIVATAGALSAQFAFTFSGNTCNAAPSCSLLQNIHFLANPGQLNQTQAGGDVNLGALTLNGLVQNLTGAINQDVVTDARGTSAGWTLNAKLTNLTNNGGSPTVNGTIPATNMAWTPACVVTSGGATPTTGSSTTLSNSDQLFCSVPSGTGNGVFTADAGLNLTVPATADAGTYNAILTLTLS